jgi:hypothetical protein
MLEYHNNAIEATAGLFSMTTSHKVDSIPLIQLNFITLFNANFNLL